MRFVSTLAAAALALCSPPAFAGADTPISLKDPKAFVAAMAEMGYAPSKVEFEPKSTALVFTVNGLSSDMSLVGCKAGKDCEYLFVYVAFRDIVNPPADWMARINEKFDLVKVRKNAKGLLEVSNAYVVEGMPRATFKRIIDYWDADTAGVGDEAAAAGLTSGK